MIVNQRSTKQSYEVLKNCSFVFEDMRRTLYVCGRSLDWRMKQWVMSCRKRARPETLSTEWVQASGGGGLGTVQGTQTLAFCLNSFESTFLTSFYVQKEGNRPNKSNLKRPDLCVHTALKRFVNISEGCFYLTGYWLFRLRSDLYLSGLQPFLHHGQVSSFRLGIKYR